MRFRAVEIGAHVLWEVVPNSYSRADQSMDGAASVTKLGLTI